MSDGEGGNGQAAGIGTPPIEIHGTLHGLARKVGKIGGEVLVFQITSHNHELWNRMLLVAEQNVTLQIVPQQASLPGVDDAAPKKRGPGRPRKEPTPLSVEKG